MHYIIEGNKVVDSNLPIPQALGKYAQLYAPDRTNPYSLDSESFLLWNKGRYDEI